MEERENCFADERKSVFSSSGAPLEARKRNTSEDRGHREAVPEEKPCYH